MTTTRPLPPTNLKERIAALEQLSTNTNGAGVGGPSSSRATSPTPSATPNSAATVQQVSALRDKIARFERKGGVPVPRGRFGLGAPPVSGGPRRQGELYGNRMPAPMRAVSAHHTGGSLRAPSPVGSADNRRSVSAMSMFSDLESEAGGFDYDPVGSPTFAFPLDSPESGQGMTPEVSPVLSPVSVSDPPVGFRRTFNRGVSFHEALGVARKAEMAKLEADAPPMPNIIERKDSSTTSDGPGSEEAVDRLVDEGPVQLQQDQAREIAPVGALSPISTLENGHISSETSPIHESPTPQPSPLPEVSPIMSSPVDEVKPSSFTPVQLSQVEVAPLAIRKRSLTDPSREDSVTPPPSIATRQEVIPEAESPVHGETPSGSFEKRVVSLSSTQPITETTDRSPTSLDTLQSSMVPQIVIENRQSIASVAALQSPEAPVVDAPSKHDEATAGVPALSFDATLLEQVSVSPPATAPSTSEETPSPPNFDIGQYMMEGSPTKPRFPDTPQSEQQSANDDAPTSSPQEPINEPQPRLRNKPSAVQPPDPSNFLSPPPTGFRSAILSSGGSSFGTISSNGSSRPMSMIETSPGQVSRALRMTPATGRGVPVFLPPTSSKPRKSDFVYFPPSPEGVPQTADGDDTILEEEEVDGGEFGTIIRERRGSAPDLTKSAKATVHRPQHKGAAFRAVVHGKVRETPVSATMPRRLPQTPQGNKRATILEFPLSPGHGELAALLQEAMLLEDTLNKGELPGETPDQKKQLELERQKKMEEEAREALVKEEEKRQQEERQRIALASAQLQAKRDGPSQGRLKHTFLVPLSKARAAHKKEASAVELEPVPRKSHESSRSAASTSEQHPPKSARIQQSPPTPQRGTTQRTPENQAAATSLPVPTVVTPAATLPTKSPRMGKFSGFKRFGSMSKPSSHDSSARHSVSTSSEISSEDSTAVLTPPDNALEFGMKASTESLPRANSMAFPSVSPKSPKKVGATIGRATSFAEKMFSRSRTKSNGSVLSTTSERTVDDFVPSLPPFSKPPSINLPSLPSFDTHLLPTTPSRASSLKRTMDLPPIPQTAVPTLPPLPNIYTSQIPSKSYTNISENDSYLHPSSDHSFTRPSSMTSLSSAGSLPSPLFDKDIFDAFPSVPGTMPTPVITLGGHRREQSLAAAVAATADFDSALLSSAIHIAARKVQGPPTSAVPSAKTPTQPGRRSGESAR